MAKTILSVDDSASMRQIVKLTLTGGGYEVLEAHDGHDGLAKARAFDFHLVVTDLNMPNMDGLSLIKELRKLPNYKCVPIIFLTTESDDSKKAEAKQSGVTAWITKPFKQEQLLAVVKKVLG